MCGKDPEDAVIEAVLCCAPIAVLGKCSPNEPLFIGIMISYYISLHIIITHNRNMYQPTSIIGWDRGIYFKWLKWFSIIPPSCDDADNSGLASNHQVQGSGCCLGARPLRTVPPWPASSEMPVFDIRTPRKFVSSWIIPTRTYFFFYFIDCFIARSTICYSYLPKK